MKIFFPFLLVIAQNVINAAENAWTKETKVGAMNHEYLSLITDSFMILSMAIDNTINFISLRLHVFTGSWE